MSGKLKGWYLSGIALMGALVVATGVGLAADQKADQITPEAAEFFEAKVRPVLVNNCFGCHSDKQQQGNLRLDSLANMLKGNSGGAVIVAGNPDKSPLVHVIRYDGKVKMPPSGKLKQADIDVLTSWVKMGAPWPGTKVSEAAEQAAKTGEYVITDQQRKFWSFQPVRKPAVPVVKNKAWVSNPVDNFVLAKLEKKGLKPSPRADKRTLIRRAYLDLIGLPPTAEEVEQFLADKSPGAFTKVVDHLLASPRYGERWARHWLDLARYADERGYVFVEERKYPYAYTFRDYVIRAFNEDLPYDQFILQQLAADKLPLGEDRRPLAAMGFLTVGRRFLNNPHDIADDRIDVTMRGFLGMTVNCARCHDHKFDPIPTKDYYSLYGIFASSVESNPLPAISPRNISEPWEQHNKKIFDAEKQRTTTIQQQVGRLRRMVNQQADSVPEPIKKTLQDFRVGTLPNDAQLGKLRPSFEQTAQDLLKNLEQTIADLKKSMPQKPELAMAMEDGPSPVKPQVFIRGNPNNRGAEIPRQFLAILTGPDRKPFTEGSGRLELAKAIASKDNPLTARVMVNRVWKDHFGYGIVRTPSDFGTRGEPPTHPELLDYLASYFVESGWSIKKLHRLILLSSTWQQASDIDPASFAADPENRLLSRMNRQRLDLEALRDSLLYVAGRLDLATGGPSVDIVQQPFSRRRTIYANIERQNVPGLFRIFDVASPDTTTAQRYTTTVPQQALFMMNSPFVVEQAKELARRPEIAACKTDEERIRAVYRIALSRAPSAKEIAVGLTYLRQPDTRTARLASVTDQVPALPGLAPFERYVQALLMTNEFCFVD
jgi:mono/diheme cytochrome c family protein